MLPPARSPAFVCVCCESVCLLEFTYMLFYQKTIFCEKKVLVFPRVLDLRAEKRGQDVKVS